MRYSADEQRLHRFRFLEVGFLARRRSLQRPRVPEFVRRRHFDHLRALAAGGADGFSWSYEKKSPASCPRTTPDEKPLPRPDVATVSAGMATGSPRRQLSGKESRRRWHAAGQDFLSLAAQRAPAVGEPRPARKRWAPRQAEKQDGGESGSKRSNNTLQLVLAPPAHTAGARQLLPQHTELSVGSAVESVRAPNT